MSNKPKPHLITYLCLIALFVSVSFKSYCQYLPLTGGTLTGNLGLVGLNASAQIQAPYLGFSAFYAQPTTSGNFAIFPNSSTGTVDVVGAGWRFIPANSSSYPTAVMTIDVGGNITASGNTFIGKNLSVGTTGLAIPLSVQGGTTTTGMANIATSLTARFNTANPPVVLGVGYVSSDNPFLQAFNSVNSTANSLIMNPFGGNVLIGQSSQVNSAYKLDVLGSVRATAITVNSTGADFVFEPTYHLFPLADLKKYLDQNHHLPEIPSAKEMQTNGLNVGDNQIKLLQKVEELTLYLIEKDKENKELKQQLLDQDKRIKALEEKLNELLKSSH